MLQYSCSRPLPKEEIAYFENSNIIKTRKQYTSYDIKDSGNYIFFNYYKNGNLHERAEHKNGLLNGSLKAYYEDGIIKYEGIFKDEIENGVFRWYNEEGFLITEELIINGKGILLKNFVQYHLLDESEYGYETYRIRNDTMFETESDIQLDSLLQPIDSISFYYKTNLLDTISGNDTINFSIELKLDDYAFNGKITLYLGEFNNDLNITDTISIFQAESGNHFINVKYKPDIFGYQLITGIIDIIVNNPSDPSEKYGAELSFYKQLFVQKE